MTDLADLSNVGMNSDGEDDGDVGSGDEAKEVLVEFVTRGPAAENAPAGRLGVPVQFDPVGLSDLLNKLLDQEADPRDYEFLIDGSFLRSSLGAYLKGLNQSGEAGLTLEYLEALPEPESSAFVPHPDWISAVDGSFDSLVLSGCYDGAVRLYEDTDAVQVADETEQKEFQTAVATGMHRGPVKAVRLLHTAVQGGSQRAVSVSMDRTVCVWSVEQRAADDAAGKKTTTKKKKESGARYLQRLGMGTHHNNSVVGLEVGAKGRRFVTSDFQGTIFLWNAPETGDKLSSASSAGPAEKKRRLDASTQGNAKLRPVACFDDHKQSVQALSWPHPHALYSGSWDSTVRHWNLEMQKSVSTWRLPKAVLSISFSLQKNLLVTSHADNQIRFVDPRAADSQSATVQLSREHTGWVTKVCWAPDWAGCPNMLASAGHDGTVKLWDVRSRLPMHSLDTFADRTAEKKAEKKKKKKKAKNAAAVAAAEDKVLALDWHRFAAGGTHILSGGTDKKLRAHRLNSASKHQ